MVRPIQMSLMYFQNFYYMKTLFTPADYQKDWFIAKCNQTEQADYDNKQGAKDATCVTKSPENIRAYMQSMKKAVADILKKAKLPAELTQYCITRDCFTTQVYKIVDFFGSLCKFTTCYKNIITSIISYFGKTFYLKDNFTP